MATPRLKSEMCFATKADCDAARAANFEHGDTGVVTAGPCHSSTAVQCYQDRHALTCFSSASLCLRERQLFAELFPDRNYGPCRQR